MSKDNGKGMELIQVPIALFEVLSLASDINDPKAKQIAKLMDSVINVTLDNPEALVKLSEMAEKGCAIRFST